jgi:putative tricarboxylic transport membrane protein
MAKLETEIVVDDPTAPEEDSPPVATMRSVDVWVMLLLLGFALLMAFDNWRTGISWASDGPQPGYFPFYLSVALAGAALYGLAGSFLSRA